MLPRIAFNCLSHKLWYSDDKIKHSRKWANVFDNSYYRRFVSFFHTINERPVYWFTYYKRVITVFDILSNVLMSPPILERKYTSILSELHLLHRRRVVYGKTMVFFNQRYLWKLTFDWCILYNSGEKMLQHLHCYKEHVKRTSEIFLIENTFRFNVDLFDSER